MVLSYCLILCIQDYGKWALKGPVIFQLFYVNILFFKLWKVKKHSFHMIHVHASMKFMTFFLSFYVSTACVSCYLYSITCIGVH